MGGDESLRSMATSEASAVTPRAQTLVQSWAWRGKGRSKSHFSLKVEVLWLLIAASARGKQTDVEFSLGGLKLLL